MLSTCVWAFLFETKKVLFLLLISQWHQILSWCKSAAVFSHKVSPYINITVYLYQKNIYFQFLRYKQKILIL